MGSAAEVSKKKEELKEKEIKTEEKQKKPEKKRKKKPKVKRLTPNAIIKRIKFGETGVSCVVDSFGEDRPEVFSEEPCGVKCYAVANSNFSFVTRGKRTGAKNFSGYK